MTAAVTEQNQSLVFAQYAEWLRRKNASPHTLKGFAIVSRRLDRWLLEREMSAESARMGDLEDYFDSLALSPSSKGTHLRYIQAAFAYGARRGTIRDNQAIDVVIAKPDPKEPRTIPGAELRKIRSGIQLDRDWLWFHFLVYTGMRRFEIAGLRWDDGGDEGSVLKLAEQTIRVLGKSRKLRTVPIHPALQECLAERPAVPGTFVIPSTGTHGIALDTIQIMTKRLHPVFTPHDFRRTVATSLRRNGVDESVRNRIMGWGAKDIFQRFYDNVADAELHRGILRLYGDDPIL